MAVDLGDHRSGFQHSEVVVFINEEVLSNGGGPDFYLTFCSRPWNEIENELRSILADPQVPFPIKRACAWSALALSVRVAARQREQQARRVRQLQEQVEERETVVWALASQLQQLRAEREKMVSQLRCARDDLRRVLEEREVLRGQLLQPKRLPQEVARRSRAPQLGIEVWPMTAEERNKVLAERSQRWHESQREEAQMASTTGVLYVPEPPSPWAQVVQPSLPMPFPTPLPYPPPPLPRVVSEAAAAAGTAFPPRMPNGGIYPPGMWPAAGFQEETALQWHQSSQGQKEGPVMPHFINPSVYSWSQGDPRNQQPQGQMPRPPKAPGTLSAAEEAPGTASAAEEAPETASAAEEAPGTASAAEEAPGTASAAEEAPGTASAAEEAPGTLSATEEAPGTASAAEEAPGTLSAAEEAPGTASAAEEAPGTLSAAEEAPGTASAAEEAPGTLSAAEEAPGTTSAAEEAPAPSV
nr:testis-expressed protein 13D-like [Equus asinus]